MAVKRFGPVLGAGVQVEEKEPEQEIQAAPLGVTVMVGEFEKGEVGEPGFPSGVRSFERRYGGRIQQGDAPQAAQDFYRLGRGAGELIPYRVTAGDEVQAELTVYNRGGYTSGPGRAAHSLWKAKNGGKWGGQRKCYVDEITGASDFNGGVAPADNMDTGDTMIENEWAGGTLQLKKVTTKTYRIVGNTAAGVVSVETDQDLLTDWNAGSGTPANRYVLTRENVDHLGNDKHLSLKFKDGQEDSAGEWGVEVYVDNSLVLDYKNLSSDPTQPNYFVNVVNDDPSNFEVTVEDLFSGDKTVASARPANFYGESKALTSTVLTLPDPEYVVSSPGSADPTVLIAVNSLVERQTIVGTVGNSGADITWVSSLGLTTTQTAFDGVLTDLGDELVDVTVTNGGTALSDGDTITITVLALEPDEAIGGMVWPDVVNEPNLSFTITDNDRTTVTVRTGLDLTDDGAISAGEVFKLEYLEEMGGGHNGSDVTDTDYLAAFDSNLSTLNKIFGKNKGLVKIASPGVTSTTVAKAGIAYADSRNYQYFVEVPSNVTTEDGAVNHINTTIGRSDYAFTYFPTWGYVADPDSESGADDVAMKLVPLCGQILGRHALMAYNYNGYHKAPAGIDVTLPDVLELTTGDAETAAILNEEILNPQGVNVVKFRQGTVIVWGDRTISPTSAWKWLHQRSLLSNYENVLRENFDWIIFALNNKETQERLKTTLRAYFLPEWVKGAIRGDKFEGDAIRLKIDSENNTDATRAAGDLNAEITLRLADTVERLKIVIGKAGIFDSVE